MDQHNIEKRNASCAQPVNEVGRIAVALPEDVTFYSDRRFIAVAFDADAHGVMPEILGGSRSYLPFRAAYEIFSDLCGDRAIRTVDGELLVDGKIILPERYLALWRTAIGQPVTPSLFADRYGYEIVAILGGTLANLHGKRKSWSSSPFETFDDFEAVYRDRIEYLDDDQRFRIAFDLKQEHAARDAFYLESFIASSDADKRNASSVVLKPIDSPHLPSAMPYAPQSDLFVPITEAA